MKVILNALSALMAMATPVFADTTAMKETLSAPPDGYQSETEEDTNAHLAEFARSEGDEGTYSIVEVNFERDMFTPLITLASGS